MIARPNSCSHWNTVCPTFGRGFQRRPYFAVSVRGKIVDQTRTKCPRQKIDKTRKESGRSIGNIWIQMLHISDDSGKTFSFVFCVASKHLQQFFHYKIRVMPGKIGGKCLFPEPFIGNPMYFVHTFLSDYLTESVKVVKEKRKSFVNNGTKISPLTK